MAKDSASHESTMFCRRGWTLGGMVLTASFPSGRNSREGRGKDQGHPNKGTIQVYSIGVDVAAERTHNGYSITPNWLGFRPSTA